jgi:Flp pilus assembly pilin Flp
MLKNFWLDQNGAVVSIELVLIITLTVLALTVGLSEVAVAVNTELNDISNAVGALNQSYAFTGFHSVSGGKFKSCFSGSSYHDHSDDGDNNSSCDLVCSFSSISAERGGY